MDTHELTAGYALDALDLPERETYEEHLSTCARCREDLQGFWQVSGALAHAAGGPMPPASLRRRILEQARNERSNVIPLRRPSRFVVPALSSIAAVAAVAAIGLGLWASALSGDLDGVQSELAVLGHPNARSFESSNRDARLVVTPSGEAALVVRTLPPAPEGKDYEIWIFEDGVAQRAGLFERPGATLLTRRLEPGQTVAVTLEADGGVDAPTGASLFTASTA